MKRSGKLLLVEDEERVAKVLIATLSAEGFTTRHVETASEALDALEKDDFSGIVLDLGLPDIDGREVVSRVRQTSNIPIVVLSARGAEKDKIDALDRGADDYVDKPFLTGELIARIRAALRSRDRISSTANTFRSAGFEVDFERRRVMLEGEEIKLSQREHSFICALARKPGSVVKHKDLIAAVWGSDTSAETQHLRVLAAQVRQKIEEDQSRPSLVLTEPGVGYRLGTSRGV
jgi:two-component system KDP operon response regulator KdpE